MKESWYSLGWGLGGPHSQSRCFGEDKNLVSQQGLKLGIVRLIVINHPPWNKFSLPCVHHHCIPKDLSLTISSTCLMYLWPLSCQKSSSITFTATVKFPCYVALGFVSQSVGPLSPNAVSMAIAVWGLSGTPIYIHPEEGSCCICKSRNYCCMHPNPKSWRNALNSNKTKVPGEVRCYCVIIILGWLSQLTGIGLNDQTLIPVRCRDDTGHCQTNSRPHLCILSNGYIRIGKIDW